MPIIQPEILDCSFYMYPNEGAARSGERVGGCGFFVGSPIPREGYWHVYAITNKHVIDGGNYVVRMNTVHGRFTVLVTDPGEWTTAADDDVAVLPIVPSEDLRFNFIPVSMFMLENPAERGVFDLEVGDDAVLIGRLITHDGRQRNKPIARFGSIAMMADAEEPIRITADRNQVAFLIDCRSLSGASGSAVLGFRVPHRGNAMILGGSAPLLLGIDCAHLPFWTRVYERPNRQAAIDNMWVESNSGIAVVVPAWKILATLNQPHLVVQRERENAKLLAEPPGQPDE